VTAVHVSPLSRHYVAALAQASRRHPSVAVGASPRAAMALIRTGSALAVADGRGFVTAGDIETACEPALAHRLQLNPEAEVSGVEPADIVRELLDLVPVPLGDEAPPDRD
jgi:MoxR-like ATPase